MGALTWLFIGVLFSRAWNKPEHNDKKIRIPLPRSLWPIPLVATLAAVLFYLNTLPGQIRSDGETINGILAGANGRHEEAIGHLRRAVSDDSLNLSAFSYLGVELVQTQKQQELLSTMDMMLKKAPDYPKLNLMRAWALNNLKRYPEALEAIDKELRLCSDMDAYIVLSRVCASMRDTAKERTALEMTLQKSIDGNRTSSLNYAAPRLVGLTNSVAEAQQLRPLYERLEATFPSEEIVVRCVGEIYSKVGDNAGVQRIVGRLEQMRK
jgi:tetratricopeptide (TPR) repeat protein